MRSVDLFSKTMIKVIVCILSLIASITLLWNLMLSDMSQTDWQTNKYLGHLHHYNFIKESGPCPLWFKSNTRLLELFISCMKCRELGSRFKTRERWAVGSSNLFQTFISVQIKQIMDTTCPVLNSIWALSFYLPSFFHSSDWGLANAFACIQGILIERSELVISNIYLLSEG